MIKKELTTVDPKEFGLEAGRAAVMKAAFDPMLNKMIELEKDYNEVKKIYEAEGPTDEVLSMAKILRLKYVKVRTGTAEIHKREKAVYLAAGRFVDAWKNVQLVAGQGIEKDLSNIENHWKNLEKQIIKDNQVKRAELLIIEDPGMVIPDSLGQMTTEVWENFYSGVKANIAAKKEAEEKAEKERVEKERIQTLTNERRFQCAKLSNFIDNYDTVDFGNMSEESYLILVEAATIKQKKAEADQKEKDKKEREKQKKLRAEKAALEAKLKAEQEAKEAARKEQERKEKEIQEEKNRLAAADDKIKVDHFVSELLSCIDNNKLSLENAEIKGVYNKALIDVIATLDVLKRSTDK